MDACHTLVGSGMSREALYVAMTRGREANIAYVATDAVDPSCDQLPDVHAVRTGRQVLEQVLGTSSSEQSATQTLAERHDSALSLKTLRPIRETLAATVQVPPDRVPCCAASPADLSPTDHPSAILEAIAEIDALIAQRIGALVGNESLPPHEQDHTPESSGPPRHHVASHTMAHAQRARHDDERNPCR